MTSTQKLVAKSTEARDRSRADVKRTAQSLFAGYPSMTIDKMVDAAMRKLALPTEIETSTLY